MEPEILLAKLESLGRCLKRLEEKKPLDYSRLEEDIDIQDIIILNLERAVQQSVDAGLHVLVDYGQSRINTMAEVFTALEQNGIISSSLAKDLIGAVGFRNIAVHEYRSIDWKIVWTILTEKLKNFRDYQKALLTLIP